MDGQKEAVDSQKEDFNVLMQKLPRPPDGWTGEEPHGTSISTPSGSYSYAERSYTQIATDKKAHVTIYHFPNTNLFAPFWMSWMRFHEHESSEGYARKVKIRGYPGWEIYDKNSDNYELYVAISNETGIYISTYAGRDALYDFANAIDYEGLASLFGEQSPSESHAQTQNTTNHNKTSQTTPQTIIGGKMPDFGLIYAVVACLLVAALMRRR